MSLPPGTQVGAYTIESLLGSGGMGEVYRAKDDRLGRIVAIKLLHSVRQASAEARSRFLQEARLVSSLQHPNIVTLFDIGRQGDVDYLVFEYCSGKTLAQVIGTKGMRLEEALRTAIAVADALAKAHAAGVLHRDLKPGNIVVAEDGTVKVLDFGLAKLAVAAAAAADGSTHTIAAEPLSREGTVVGTPGYMSPEQAEGRTLDVRSDIFSFGAVLYEMLTGRRAFQGDSTASVLAAILREDPPAPASLNRSVPRDVEKVVQRCLRKDPDRRYQSMADVRVELQELKEAWDSGTLSSVAIPAAPRKTRSKWIGLAAASVIPLALAGYLLRGREEIVEPELHAVPMASHPGDERDPTFSPDGTQVAFCWDGEDGKSLDLYVQLVGSTGKPIRLTNTPDVVEIVPQWSPDGRWIAFTTIGGGGRDSAIVVVPALGGPEKTVTRNAGSSWFGWTPDSRGIIHATYPEFALQLTYLDGSTTKTILRPPNSSVRYWSPQLSPDGSQLAFGIIEGENMTLAAVPVNGNYEPTAQPTRLAPELRQVIWPIWTNDNKEIVFIDGTRNSDSTMWRVSASGGRPRRIPVAGDGAWVPAIARRGHRMAFTRLQKDDNLARIELGSGGEVSKKAPEVVLASTQIDINPTYSPDGKRIAFSSSRSGSQEIWVASADGKDAVAVTTMGGMHTIGPVWSPVSNEIAFESRGDGRMPTGIYVVTAPTGQPKRVTSTQARAILPRWSSDGKFLYYRTAWPDKLVTWKVPLGGGQPVLAADENHSECSEVADGTLYCLNRNRQLVRMEHGTPTVVTDLKTAASLVASGPWLYSMVGTGDRNVAEIVRIDPRTGKQMVVGQVVKARSPGLTVSPDQKYLMYTMREQFVSDLMLVDGFR